MINKFLHKGDLPDNFSVGKSIAIDTETMGLIHGRDRLCLIQVSSGDGNAHIVQFKMDYTAPNLRNILTNDSITKIFHFARFDMAIILSYMGITIKSCYCTKIASKLARTYSANHGLKEVCGELLGIKINKQQQSSDWGRENLTPEQIEYAAYDVLFLHQIRDRLNAILIRENRMELANSCFKFLETRVALDLSGWTGDIFAHE